MDRNIVILNGFVHKRDLLLLFSEEDIVEFRSPLTTMIDILLLMKIFPSRGQARKNWKGSVFIPDGWSEFFIGRHKRHLCIWNPTEGLNVPVRRNIWEQSYVATVGQASEQKCG